jgi:hypothetical protein
MHGSYAILWLIKSRLFGDASWAREIGFTEGLYPWLGMSLYLVAESQQRIGSASCSCIAARAGAMEDVPLTVELGGGPGVNLLR